VGIRGDEPRERRNQGSEYAVAVEYAEHNERRIVSGSGKRVGDDGRDQNKQNSGT